MKINPALCVAGLLALLTFFTVHLALAQTNFTILKSFSGNPDGAVPYATLVQDTNAVFYGTTLAGGISNAGTVFSLGQNGYGYMITSGYKTLMQFLGTNGFLPYAGLTLASDGYLYGTTFAGGISNFGTVFRISRSGDSYALLHGFTGTTDGKNPETGLIEGNDGALYGTTYFVDATTRGTVFKINKNGTGYSIMHTFSGNPDGQQPQGRLLQGSDGALYGTAGFGGSHGRGVIFTINNDGSGYNVFYTFGNISNDGGQPMAGLIEGSDQMLYGTTYHSGGTGYDGTVFSINKSGGNYQVLHRFSTSNGDGQRANGELIEGTNGALYGMTDNSAAGNGSIFKLNKDGGNYTLIRIFSNTGDGSIPRCALLRASNGIFYGTTEYGGLGGGGCVFALSDSPLPSHVVSVFPSKASNLVQFIATAATQNDVQRSTNLTAWTTLTTVTSPASCFFNYTDSFPPLRGAFYRLQKH